MTKKKIAFIKFGGLACGGTEKHLQTLAANLPVAQFDVTYFYCDAAPYIGSDFKHIDTDPFRQAYMEKSHVKLVKFSVGFKNVTIPTHDWVDTNFWDIFNEEDFDIIQTGRSGHSEYPFTLINKTTIVDSLHLPGHVENKSNVAKTVLVSPEQRDIWVKIGGIKENCMVIPNAIEMPIVLENLRSELGLDEETTIAGMHQRPDDGIFSPWLIASYALTKDPQLHLLVLGGSDLYRQHAAYLNIPSSRITFLPPTGDVEYIHKFLNTLDFYTHARKDGEQCSTALMEAMFHGLPIIGHPAPSMGHEIQIGNSGFICKTPEDYSAKISLLCDRDTRERLSILARQRYNEEYSLPSVVDSYVKLYNTIT